MRQNQSVVSGSQRRLAAIVVTDIVGYSAMAQRDEPLALDVLRRNAEIIEPLVAGHNGRVVKSLGDGYLADFASASEAVTCAQAIQSAIADVNAAEREAARRFHVRIGVHLGDVEHREGDIFGDGVNIASRINRFADPGGVCVSEDVYRQVGGQPGLAFRPLGTPPLKNIGRSIELYSLVIDKGGSARTVGRADASTSIAVLPFANFSSDPENEHFCAGLADELISALTRVRKLRVVSRTSSFAFKGHERPLREMGEILGVDIVVEGSVRKSGHRIRVTAQVIDIESDTHLWSGTYDREMEDILAIQDELSASIVSALEIAITPEERESLVRSGTKNMTAYELYLQGIQQYWRFNITGLRASCSLFREAIALDPGFVRAYSSLAQSAAYHFLFWRDSTMLDDARWAADKLMQIAPDSAEAAVSDGLALLLAEEYDRAHARFVEATERDPQSYDAWYVLGRCRFVQGRYPEAIEAYERAASIRVDDFQCLCLAQVACRSMGDEVKRRELAERVLPALTRHRRLHPDDVRAAYFEGSVRTVLGEKDVAVRCVEHAISLVPHDQSVLYNAACVYCLLGMRDEALDCLEKTAESGFADHEWLMNDMDLRELRDDPRFLAVLAMVEHNRWSALGRERERPVSPGRT